MNKYLLISLVIVLDTASGDVNEIRDAFEVDTFLWGAKLKDNLLAVENDNKNLFVIPTKSDNGDYAVMLTYALENFEEDITGNKVTVWCIDDHKLTKARK